MRLLVHLEHSDIELSRIGFGCAGLMRTPTARGRQALLGAAFDAGLTHFDVARLYGLGQAERELGTFARNRRGSLTIATKFGIAPARFAGLAKAQAPARFVLSRFGALRRVVKRQDEVFAKPRLYDVAVLKQHLHQSLRELRTDYVDVLFVHDPTPDDRIDADELLAALTDMRSAGKIRAWGVSQDAHHNLDVIERLGPTTLLQIRADIFSPFPSTQPRLTFGAIARAHARIRAALGGDPSLHTAWSYALGTDPMRENELARLLLAESLGANNEGAVLYSTSHVRRLQVAEGALVDPPESQVLNIFRTLCGDLDIRSEV